MPVPSRSTKYAGFFPSAKRFANPNSFAGIKPSGLDSPDLTLRQIALYEWFYDRIRATGYQPSVKEIASQFGIRSPNGIACYMKSLQAKGYISTSGKSRSARLLKRPDGRPFHGFIDREVPE